MVVPGFLLGVVGSLAFRQLIESLLWQVHPVDPITLSLVSAMLGVAAIVATIAPVRRASLVDPAVVLRDE